MPFDDKTDEEFLNDLPNLLKNCSLNELLNVVQLVSQYEKDTVPVENKSSRPSKKQRFV